MVLHCIPYFVQFQFIEWLIFMTHDAWQDDEEEIQPYLIRHQSNSSSVLVLEHGLTPIDQITNQHRSWFLSNFRNWTIFLLEIWYPTVKIIINNERSQFHILSRIAWLANDWSWFKTVKYLFKVITSSGSFGVTQKVI